MPNTRQTYKRPTIGFFVDNLFDVHQEELRRAVAQTAREADVNLICFLGGPAWGQRHGRVVYDLATPETVDAIISVSGCLDMLRSGGGVGCFDPETFYGRFAPLPIVSINKAIRGMPSLLIENAIGSRQLVDHFIEAHQCRRIAYIRGPERNDEAQARFGAYLAALEEHGLPYEPARVFLGDFDRASGTQAVEAFLDERRIEFDALIAANDLMAVHAMRELQRRGISIPDDVAIGGFDDNRAAISVMPSLTTVRQPLRDIGRTAVQQALALIRGETVAESTCFAAELIVRRSCGCAAQSGIAIDIADVPDDRKRLGGSALRAFLVHELKTMFPWVEQRVTSTSWAEDLIGALVGDLESAQEPESRFLPMLEALLARMLDLRIGMAEWQRILWAMFETTRRQIGLECWRRLDALKSSSLLIVGSLAEQAQATQSTQVEEEALALQRVFYRTGVEKEEEIGQALKQELPRLGVESFYLVGHVDEKWEEAFLQFHYSYNDNVVLEDRPGPFPTKRLLPGCFSRDHRYAYAVLPIHSSTEQIGFALCEMGPMSGAGYESLVYQLSRALKASSLLDEVRRYAGELELRVEERARQLRAAQQQLIETAHQAGMAEIAVGVMHNVGNILNSVSVSAEEIAWAAAGLKVDGLQNLGGLLEAHQGNLAGFLSSDPKGTLLPDYCRKLARNLESERRRIQAETTLLIGKTGLIRDTIRALQEYARDGRDMLLTEPIELSSLIGAALDIQAANVVRHGITVQKILEETPPVVGQRAKLVHVLVNLIKNAVEAMRGMPLGSRVLKVELRSVSEGRLLVRISDTGEGISKENLGKIFSYGFTTKTDGHGFGLHICANYVNQMDGSIAVESEGQGRGAAFTLSFAANPSTHPAAQSAS